MDGVGRAARVVAIGLCASLYSASPSMGGPLPTQTNGSALKIGTLVKTGAPMVWVRAGPFKYGANKGKVTIPGFWIGRTDVTWGQYKKFCQATGHALPRTPSFSIGDDHPVVNVSWDDARAYCHWAGGELPTEKQWEKAARGTDGRMYPWGNEWAADRCQSSIGYHKLGTAPVGSFPKGASPYGCLDMVGNVWQWCLDWSNGEHRFRAIRGGGWAVEFQSYLQCDYRFGYGPFSTNRHVGFRVVATNLR